MYIIICETVDEKLMYIWADHNDYACWSVDINPAYFTSREDAEKVRDIIRSGKYFSFRQLEIFQV